MAPKSIGASVGIGGKQCYNIPADQEVIMDLLDLVPQARGGRFSHEKGAWPTPRWGVCGGTLHQAILKFQSANPGLSVDGHVDPGGRTLASLNALATGSNGPKGDDSYTGTEQAIDLVVKTPVDQDTFFFIQHPRVRQGSKPIYDDTSHAVVGYVYSSLGYFEYYDIHGTRVATDEIGLEQPLFDPIDLLFIGGGIVRGIGKGFIRAGAKVAATMGSRLTLRALTAGVIATMRFGLRRLVTTRTLKFTATTAARMASRERHVPVHILNLAIKFGTREADPQKVAGLFQYTIRMFRAGSAYTLKVVVREADWTIVHFLYK